MISERSVIKFKPSNFLINLLILTFRILMKKHEDALKTIEKFHTPLKSRFTL